MNRVIAAHRGKPLLVPAPGPRRSAQGITATIMLIVAYTLLEGLPTSAWVFEAIFVVAISALLFGAFCLGAYIYHPLRGKPSFANATLPWAGSR